MGRCLGRTGVGLLFQILQQGPWFLQKRVVLGKVRNVRGQEPERVKEMQLKASLGQREMNAPAYTTQASKMVHCSQSFPTV